KEFDLDDGTLVASYHTLGNVQKLDVYGTKIFVADHVAGVHVLDVSSPGKISLMDTYNTPGFAYGVKYVNGTVYVADGTGGLHILDAGDPRNLALEGTYDTDGEARDVVVDKNQEFALVADGANGLEIIDVSNPGSCSRLALCDISDTARSVTLYDKKAYVTGDNGLYIFDISNVTNPILLGNYSSGYTIYAIQIQGGLGFMASGGRGIEVIDGIGYMRELAGITYGGDSSEMLKIRATDGEASAYSNVFRVNIKGIGGLPVYTYTEDQSLPITNLTVVSQDSFSGDLNITLSDPDAGILTTASFGDVTAAYHNETGLWQVQGNLTDINEILKKPITFIPAEDYNSDVVLDIKFDDGYLPVAERSLVLKGINVQDAPVFVNPLTNQTALVAQPFNYTVPPSAVKDADNEQLVFTAVELPTRQPLPSWLNLNATTGEFSGTPQGADKGIVLVEVTAHDQKGGNATAVFSVDVPNTVPIVNATIPQVDVYTGQNMSYPVPQETFYDPDGDIFIYSIVERFGGLLPNWLSFDNILGLFTGVPQSADRMTNFLNVTVDDGWGGMARTGMVLNVANANPVAANPFGNLAINVGGNLTFLVPSNTFSDADNDNMTLSAALEGGGSLPAFMDFNETLATFTAEPVSGDQGTYSVKLTADDGHGGTGNYVFDFFVPNRVPALMVPLANQTVPVLTPFNYTIPLGTFYTIDGDPLVYDARQSDGSPLTAWLTFDPLLRRFTGTPVGADRGIYDIEVLVHDTFGANATDIFRLTVPNTTPTVSQLIPDRIITVNSLLNFVFSSVTFSDIDGDSFLYSASLESGASLPGWLNFVGVNRLFTGTPVTGSQGEYMTRVLADDQYGGNVSTIFKITVPNRKPVLVMPLSAQIVPYNTLFSFWIPEVFTDLDGDPLVYNATMADDTRLLDWLEFNNPTRLFTGNATFDDGGNYRVRVFANDGFEDSLPVDFDLRVEVPPYVDKLIPNWIAKIGDVLSFFIDQATFIDKNGDAMLYSARLADTTPLPSFLSFNGMVAAFYGVPEEGDQGIYDVEVLANDGFGGITGTTFNLTVDHKPEVQTPISTQSINFGQSMNFTVPLGTIIDRDGNPLSYIATLSNGAPLPSWMHFDNQTLTFTGTPETGSEVQVFDIAITANDGTGGTVTTVFPLRIKMPISVIGNIEPQSSYVGQLLNYLIPSNIFSYDVYDEITYQVTMGNGDPLPSWLSFNPTTRQLSGIPPINVRGTLSLRVTARDPSGGEASAILPLNVPNRAPVQQGTILEQGAVLFYSFEYPLPIGLFYDPDNDPLNYTMRVLSGDSSWLSFDAKRMLLFGRPLTLEGSDVEITASDGIDSDSMRFSISVNVWEFILQVAQYYVAAGAGTGLSYLVLSRLQKRAKNKIRKRLETMRENLGRLREKVDKRLTKLTHRRTASISQEPEQELKSLDSPAVVEDEEFDAEEIDKKVAELQEAKHRLTIVIADKPDKKQKVVTEEDLRCIIDTLKTHLANRKMNEAIKTIREFKLVAENYFRTQTDKSMFDRLDIDNLLTSLTDQLQSQIVGQREDNDSVSLARVLLELVDLILLVETGRGIKVFRKQKEKVLLLSNAKDTDLRNLIKLCKLCVLCMQDERDKSSFISKLLVLGFVSFVWVRGIKTLRDTYKEIPSLWYPRLLYIRELSAIAINNEEILEELERVVEKYAIKKSNPDFAFGVMEILTDIGRKTQ
ncbi:putative Ig domain-containing protein, partial [bacterium]